MKRLDGVSMRILRSYGFFAGLGATALLVALFVVVGSAQAAFPGRDGLLAVQPLKGRGIVLVNPNGRGERRVCATPATGARACSLVRPQWSPDGQTLAVGSVESVGSAGSVGPVAVIYPDGSCLACQLFNLYGAPGSIDAAFTSNPTLLTAVGPPAPGFPGELAEFGVDGLQGGQALASGPLSDPVWSSRGKLALVRGGWIWVGSPHSLHRLARGSDPSWSPDGSGIVFDRKGWLMVRRLGGRMARRLARGTAPAWSPDGKWIAFIGRDHRLSVLRALGGRVHHIGDVTGGTVDWQPLPATQPAPCRTPPGSTVLANSDTAIVSVDTLRFGYAEQWAAMGCLRADGRERVLTSGGGGRGYPYVSRVVLAGTFAALEITNSYTFCTTGITVYDLQTRKGSDYYDGFSCPVPTTVPPAAGIDPLLLNANGFAAWRVTRTEEPPYALEDVACPTTSLCVAVDSEGNAVTSTDPTGGSNAWTISPIAGALGLNGVACPSVSLCVAVGGVNTLATVPATATVASSTNPAGGSGAWTASSLATGSLNDVSCPSVSLCVAVGGDTIATSTDPTGGPGAWTITSLPGDGLSHISCPSVSLCVAVGSDNNGDNHILTSTDPTGGAGAWNTTPLNPAVPGITGISCPSTTLCVVGDDTGPYANYTGQVITSTNPTGGSGAWTVTHINGAAFAPISCPSTSLCVGAGFTPGSNAIATSTNPTGGAAAWTTVNAAGASVLGGISCPSTSLCVDVGQQGQVTTSTNPTGGASAWSTTTVDNPACTPCIAEQLYAHDNQGTKIVDSAPPGSGTEIGNVQLTGDQLTWTHNDTPHQLTLQ